MIVPVIDSSAVVHYADHCPGNGLRSVPQPSGVVGSLSLPQRSSLWRDQHAVMCPVSDNKLLVVFFPFSYHYISRHANAV